MLRVFNYLVNITLLYNSPGIHDHNALAELGSQTQIVSDQNDGCTVVPVNALHEIKNLGLNRYVQSSRRLVCQ